MRLRLDWYSCSSGVRIIIPLSPVWSLNSRCSIYPENVLETLKALRYFSSCVSGAFGSPFARICVRKLLRVDIFWCWPNCLPLGHAGRTRSDLEFQRLPGIRRLHSLSLGPAGTGSHVQGQHSPNPQPEERTPTKRHQCRTCGHSRLQAARLRIRDFALHHRH